MFNPDMMKMAMEQMNRMTPEQMRQMQQMAANMDPAQMAQMQQMAVNMDPAQMRQMQQQAGGMGGMGGMGGPPAQQQAQLPRDGRLAEAQALKAAGNKLHTDGSYEAASAKYNQARRLADGTSAEGKALVKACLLNLASCGLKLQRHAEVVQYTSEVLTSEPNNVKALYRRGQALLAQGDASKAVPDIQKAIQNSSPDDAAVMQEVLDRARAQAGSADGDGDGSVTVEDITQSEAAPPPPVQAPEAPPPRTAPPQPGMPPGFDPAQVTMATEMMRNNPGMMSMMENMVGGMSQEQLDAMAAATGQPRITTAQAKAQVAALKGMSPEQLAAVSQQRFTPGQAASPADLARTADMLQANPELMKQSLEMMRTMPPEQLQAAAQAAGAPPGFFSADRMEELAAQAASMTPEQIQEAARVAAAAHASQAGSAPLPRSAEAPTAAADAPAPAASAAPSVPLEPAGAAPMGPVTAAPSGAPPGMEAMLQNPDMMRNMSSMMANLTPEDMQRMSSMAGAFGGGDGGGPGAGGMPEVSADMMSKLATPEMMDTMQRMMKGMDPAALAGMMKQSGMDVTPEQAASMQQQLDKLSPTQMQWLMAAATWTQRALQAAQRARAWLVARPLVMAAIVVLFLAVLLRRFGWA
jgi:hypothetical protein